MILFVTTHYHSLIDYRTVCKYYVSVCFLITCFNLNAKYFNPFRLFSEPIKTAQALFSTGLALLLCSALASLISFTLSCLRQALTVERFTWPASILLNILSGEPGSQSSHI